MEKQFPSRLRFNLGFLLEASLGTSRTIELAYPTIQVATDLTLTPLTGAFVVTRTGEGIYVSGLLKSQLDITCVRCLENGQIEVSLQIDELFYYPPTTAPEGEFVVGEDGFIDLAPLVRELALLEIPIQPICKPDCRGLCVECGQNLNEGPCGCQKERIDPRLAALRALLDE